MNERNANDTHFQVLGVTRNATKEQIRIAYIREIKKWHPDNFAHNSKEHIRATEWCKKINEAYRLLKHYEPTSRTYNYKANNQANDWGKEPPKTGTSHNSSTYSGGFINVNSRMVQAVAYKSETNTLIVEHRNKLLYEFYNVPVSVYLNFLTAASKGNFMMRHIWDEYDYQVITP